MPRVEAISAAAVYQFLENAWVHPFVSAGVSVGWERERRLTQQFLPGGEVDGAQAALQLADHARPVTYEMALPRVRPQPVNPALLYIHPARGRQGRRLDEETERFVDSTRMGGTV